MNRPIDDYGVPIYEAEELESSAEKLLIAFDRQLFDSPRVTDIERVIRHFVEAGELTFDDRVEVADSPDGGFLAGRFLFSPPTIQINKRLMDCRRRRFTMAHEFAHFILHGDLTIESRDYFGDGIDDSADAISGSAELPPARHWMEWQARRYAAALLVPQPTIRTALDSARIDTESLCLNASRAERIVLLARHLGATYEVSPSVARYRLEELDLLDGIVGRE
jgi:hypothetical protein